MCYIIEKQELQYHEHSYDTIALHRAPCYITLQLCNANTYAAALHIFAVCFGV
jgi:hypothetical protein